MTVRTILVILSLLMLPTHWARAQDQADHAPLGSESARDATPQSAPRHGWVRVEFSAHSDPMSPASCLRRSHRVGYGWITGREGLEGQEGVWLQGHWQPETSRPGQVWVPGHPGRDGRWVLGFWRQAALTGFVWLDGYWLSGVWQQGHWNPREGRSGYVWVHGHLAGDSWRIGHWRARLRTGSTWVPAHWRRGAWMAGFWHVGAWVFGPGDLAIPYAQPLDKEPELNRETVKKIVRPRYVAYLLGVGADERQEDDASSGSSSEREGPEADRGEGDRTPKKRGKEAGKKAKRETKSALKKKKKRRPLLRRSLIPARPSAPRAKPVSRRRGGKR
jgi:hypothetical protein